MHKNIFTIAIGLISLSILTTACFAQETFTLTTYYPAPFGVYNQLVTQTLGVGDNNPSITGIDTTDAPNPSANPGDVWIAGKVGIGTSQPRRSLDVRGGPINFAWNDQITGGSIYASYASDSTNYDEELVITFGAYDRNGDGLINRLDSGDDRSMIWIGPEFDNGGVGTIKLDARKVVVANAKLGLDVGSPQAKLDVNGGVKIGSTTACAANGSQNGTIRYNSGSIQYCYNGAWMALGGGDFGGMFDVDGLYLIPTGCGHPNPYTRKCSCPPGYNTEPLTGGIYSPLSGWVALSDHWIFYCWR